jgi:hypothetical protein
VATFVQFFEKRSLFPARMQPLSDESYTLEVKVEACLSNTQNGGRKKQQLSWY